MNSQPIIIMSAKFKIARKKYLNEIISVIIILNSTKKLHKKIANYIKISKLTIIQILQKSVKRS